MKDFYGLIIIIMLLGLAAEVYFLAKPRRNSSCGRGADFGRHVSAYGWASD
ncbi:hypothetical protein KOY48_03405 [Candidatus Minimicrobia naudis]|uniref:Uncharacterized protein n=1 Tax=Candidatus Minimicrobia naudis TaxID=2841263 RepID=A0A8F1MBN3_9BACT|nr:hypothetical protein KOY48_03405 [Candidatus Minimicrobia naudis]